MKTLKIYDIIFIENEKGNNMETVKLKNGLKVNIVYPNEVNDFLSDEDKEMDSRAREAIRAAIRKTNFLKSLKHF